MRYMIGYQLQESGRLLNEIVRNKEKVHEVYFAWGNMPSGRGGTASHSDLMPYETLQVQLAQLRYLADQGVGMNMLLNANCYGKDSLSRRFLMQTGDLICDFQEKLNLGSITTTSPVIARFVKENFQELVLNSTKTVLLDFWAPWCGPCRMVAPIVEEIAEERSDMVLGKINVDEEMELAVKFGVVSIPMLVVMEKGEIVNIDATVIAQAPKLKPFIENMRENIAYTCKIDVDCVNIKATTEEHLGFTGAGEGIAAHAVCLID